MTYFLRCNLRWCLRCVAIIGVLAGAIGLGGCSAVRLGYNNAPDLVYWWLDSYLDFDSAQTLRLRADLQSLQDWHRKEEVPLYADLLKNLQPLSGQQVNTEQVCAVYTTLESRLMVTADRIMPTATAIAPTLRPEQLQHLAKAWDKRNQEWREDWLDGSQQDRAQHRLKKLRERSESFYGRMNDTQLARLSTLLEGAGFDAASQYRETLRRQQDIVQTLKGVRGASEIHTQAELRALLSRSLQSPDDALRQYQLRARLQGCSIIASLHNTATPSQRNKLAQTLQNYEADARAVALSR